MGYPALEFDLLDDYFSSYDIDEQPTINEKFINNVTTLATQINIVTTLPTQMIWTIYVKLFKFKILKKWSLNYSTVYKKLKEKLFLDYCLNYFSN